jgi:hypothetical protein
MDIFGTLTGVVAGVAFAPWNKKAQAQYLVTGATKGAGGVMDTLNAGFGGTGGFVLQGLPGMKKGVVGGVGALPQMAGEELKKGTTVALAGLSIYALLPYIVIGIILIMLLRRN